MDLKTYISSERGRATQLATALGVSASYFSQMVAGTSPISAERCVDIEVATQGAVTRKDLRPDDWHKIWPELAMTHCRRATDPKPEKGRPGRQPPNPHNILDTIPEHSIVSPAPTKKD